MVQVDRGQQSGLQRRDFRGDQQVVQRLAGDVDRCLAQRPHQHLVVDPVLKDASTGCKVADITGAVYAGVVLRRLWRTVRRRRSSLASVAMRQGGKASAFWRPLGDDSVGGAAAITDIVWRPTRRGSDICRPSRRGRDI